MTITLHDDLYNPEEVDAILCVWDEIISCRLQPDKYPELNTYWDHYGTGQMRLDAIDIGMWAQSVWLSMPDDLKYYEPFDFEVVPRLLDQLRPYWKNADHMYRKDGGFPTPTIESAVAHYRLAYGYRS